MSRTAGSDGSVPGISCTASTDLSPIVLSRTAVVGNSITAPMRIRAIRTEDVVGESFNAVLVKSHADYEAGCTLHENCHGHLCVTREGCPMMPQGYAKAYMAPMSNELSNASKHVLTGKSEDPDAYRSHVTSSMHKKTGMMRAPMSGGYPQGSARFVLSPDWSVGLGWVSVPAVMFFNFKMVDVQVMPDGSDGDVYVERTLNEGDYVLFVRPPSNSLTNVLLLRIRAWKNNTIGLNPGDLAKVHGDFDGDEGELFAISRSRKVMEEVSRYRDPWTDPFIKEGTDAANFIPRGEGIPWYDSGGNITYRDTYMRYGTECISDLVLGKEPHELFHRIGNKQSSTEEMCWLIRDPVSMTNFIEGSMEGISMVMRQQLSQGVVGDMSRQARMCASMFSMEIVDDKAYCTVLTYDGSSRVLMPNPYSYDVSGRAGNHFIRAVDAFCSVAHQNVLDSHKVGSREMSKYDMVSAAFVGTAESVLIGYAKGHEPRHEWKWSPPGEAMTYYLVHKSSIPGLKMSLVFSTTETQLLARVMLTRGESVAIEVCLNHLTMMAKYYKVKLFQDEALCLAFMLCYKCTFSVLPPTNKEGLVERSMRWFPTVFANHFGIGKRVIQRNTEQRFHICNTVTERIAFYASS